MRYMGKFLVSFLGVFLLHSVSQAGWNQHDLAQRKAKAIRLLEKRKKSFDVYLKKQDERNQKRLSRAYEMKAIREKRAKKKEKARISFRRKQQEFPVKDYQAFLQKRKIKRQKWRRARTEYGSIQKELKKIYNNKRYRIDGKKEFKL